MGEPCIVMELADTAVLSTEVLLTLSAVTSPSVHGMASFYCNSIFLFKLVDQEWRHLVRIARQLWSWWLRIKPCTHRVVHVHALQRIRILLVTSLAALLHHGVRFSLVLKMPSFLGGYTWHCDMNLGRGCTGTPCTGGYSGGRILLCLLYV